MLIESDDVLLSKASTLERCIHRIREEYRYCPELDNYTHVDALVLNIERACQAAIDMAMHLVARQHLGVPKSSSDAFLLLRKKGVISQELMKVLIAITGFRNLAVHQYKELDNSILKHIAEKGYKDLIKFCEAIDIKILP